MSTDAWKRENTSQILLRITKSSGIMEVLRKMMESTGKTAPEYIREVVTAKLKADGYLSENSMPEK